MERGSITKWLLFGLAIFLVLSFGRQNFFGKKASELQPLWGINDQTAPAAAARAPEETCSIEAPRFQAVLSTRGASLRHLYLKDKQYTRPSEMPSDVLGSVKHLIAGDAKGSTEQADLVSTTREGRMPLRVDLRAPFGEAAKQQVPYDDLDWKLAAHDDKSCTFTYADAASS